MSKCLCTHVRDTDTNPIAILLWPSHDIDAFLNDPGFAVIPLQWVEHVRYDCLRLTIELNSPV